MEFPFKDIVLDGKRYKMKHAKTVEQRRRGLSKMPSIGADGMLFEYDYLTYRPFHMSHTIIPLVIAFFNEAGKFIGSRRMLPLSTEAVLPQGPFKWAIEFPADCVPEFTDSSQLVVT